MITEGSEGSRIVAGQDGGGFRDFLDGEPIHAGYGLDVWVAGRWLPGRYEFTPHDKAAYFYTRRFDPDGDEETVIRIDRNVMRFRWPPREPGSSLDERYTRAVQANTQLRSELREIRAIVRRALDDEHEDAGDERADRLRYTLLDIREMVDSALH